MTDGEITEEHIQLRTFMLGLGPYVVIEYDDFADELSVTAHAEHPMLVLQMLRSAARRVRGEYRRQRRERRANERQEARQWRAERRATR